MVNVLVTGTGSGFGRLITTTLIGAGHQVAATVRDPAGRDAERATALREEGALVIGMDVTDDVSVRTGVDAAIAGFGTLDAVVNNAGLGALGLAETYSPRDWQNIFDVNVFGVQRVTRAVAPHFRRRRKGLFLLISSMTAKLPIPFQGPYGASKAAAESLAESYRLELAPSGIESAIIEPNGFPTEFLGKTLLADPDEWRSAYGELADLPLAALQAYRQRFAQVPEHSPQLVADATLRLLELPHGTRPFRTTVDRLGLATALERVNAVNESVREELWKQMGVADLLIVR
ncbi:SDR family oxidoreductase [Kineosporia sp. J2-2]|uniref:SDR family oxidoreductase n=1 Tax=Kineosporia corallincola TaxID=2835133 RepID=A0ABS5TB07_9ACTN|nr:SDR family oxidoreductase [Kineosporia corallincola]MBT0768260.1 SDR family oxidoreductase [Kineosporia corallincola]